MPNVLPGSIICPGSASAGRGVHVGVRCDRSGVEPIVGPRYHLPGRGIDLCETEYMKLGPDQKREFIVVQPPHGYGGGARGYGGGARGYDYVTGRETGSEADFSRVAGVAY